MADSYEISNMTEILNYKSLWSQIYDASLNLREAEKSLDVARRTEDELRSELRVLCSVAAMVIGQYHRPNNPDSLVEEINKQWTREKRLIHANMNAKQFFKKLEWMRMTYPKLGDLLDLPNLYEAMEVEHENYWNQVNNVY